MMPLLEKGNLDDQTSITNIYEYVSKASAKSLHAEYKKHELFVKAIGVLDNCQVDAEKKGIKWTTSPDVTKLLNERRQDKTDPELCEVRKMLGSLTAIQAIWRPMRGDDLRSKLVSRCKAGLVAKNMDSLPAPLNLAMAKALGA